MMTINFFKLPFQVAIVKQVTTCENNIICFFSFLHEQYEAENGQKNRLSWKFLENLSWNIVYYFHEQLTFLFIYKILIILKTGEK